MERRYLLVGNPSAQSGKGLGRIDAVLRVLRDYGLDVQFLRTRPEGRTPGMVAEAIDGSACDVVVYVGGDGTWTDPKRPTARPLVAKGGPYGKRKLRLITNRSV